MAAGRAADLLVEIGTEELPPGALRSLMLAFANNLDRLLNEARLPHGTVRGYSSPRRLAVVVRALARVQEAREVDVKGPPVTVAFDDSGQPNPAARAFAGKWGVEVGELGRSKNKDGEWLSFHLSEPGARTGSLLPEIVEKALLALPIPRRMRWGDSSVEFVRPVRWILLLHGKQVVKGEVLGHAAGRVSHGHRVLCPGTIKISEPGAYVATLENPGHVLVDFSDRQQRITRDVQAAAAAAGGYVVADDALYEEVTALTEWPVVLTGHFDENLLGLPREAIIASLTGHQRYFPVADAAGDLLPTFIVVANLDSVAPKVVREGNQRVIRSRLADAAFFWETDRQTSLRARRGRLRKVVYQQGLGSLYDKTVRVGKLCETLAASLGVTANDAVGAAALAKCDLLTGMVGEFPGLQGVMGRYYAAEDGEPEAVAVAIGEQYLPRFAGDHIPASVAGRIVSVADKLDSLAGIFTLGKRPSGNKDPFGLRRAALGVIRILIEGRMEIGLGAAVRASLQLQPVADLDAAAVQNELCGFVIDRLRGFYADRADISAQIFEAVERSPEMPEMPLPDFDQRIKAVTAFAQMSESKSLASANKRISNILQKSGVAPGPNIKLSLLREKAEFELHDALQSALAEIAPLQKSREYRAVLRRLAELKQPVDRFFDEVMVMVDDAALMRNRLSLLLQLSAPFHSVADISCLSGNNETH